MKKFILKIFILLSVVFLLDRIIGYTMMHVINNIEIGGMGRDNYICNKATEDILIFGSSRAVHHYNAAMIEDSLNHTCYNCGDDGNGIILNYGRLLMCKERKLPNLILYDVATSFDFGQNDNTKYLGWLRARYDRPGISDIFKAVEPLEAYKMRSYMYRYNTRFLQNLVVYTTHISTDTGIKGFRPIHAEMDTLKIKARSYKPIQPDSLKISYIHKFLDETTESKVIFLVSPEWYGSFPGEYDVIKNICKERNLDFIDFSNNPKYVHNNTYFKDGTHLNARGADEFTKDLIDSLQTRYTMEELFQ